MVVYRLILQYYYSSSINVIVIFFWEQRPLQLIHFNFEPCLVLLLSNYPALFPMPFHAHPELCCDLLVSG